MTQKTKYEKKETKDTLPVFSLTEVHAFAFGHYAEQRRQLYLDKVRQREPNPRLINGMENLNDISMVAEIDMMPLSTRQQMGRFMKYGSEIDGDGFDAETEDTSDESFHTQDRVDLPPTPHEVRSQQLERKLKKARADHQEAVEQRLKDGATPPPKNKNDEAEPRPSAKADPSKPSE